MPLASGLLALALWVVVPESLLERRPAWLLAVSAVATLLYLTLLHLTLLLWRSRSARLGKLVAGAAAQPAAAPQLHVGEAPAPAHDDATHGASLRAGQGARCAHCAPQQQQQQ